MSDDIVKFLRAVFPFLLTVALWRLAAHFWNPAGILALIPVFYANFVRPIAWFGIFGALICFLVDYNGATPLFWTSIFCACFAANGFQNYLDLSGAAVRGLYAFAVFLGLGILILFFVHPSWTAFGRAIWTFVWTCALYVPVTKLIAGAQNDRR